MQSSTSQAPVSSSPSGGPTGGPSTPTAPAPVPPPFYYNVLPNASITSGSSQQSSSGSSVAMSNPSVSTMIIQPPVPSPSSSTGHSFMYMSHAGAGLPSGQQFQPSMRIAPGPPQVGNNALTYAAALPQSPDPGQSGHTNSFVSGNCLPLPVPSPVSVPSSSNSPRFSFYGNVQLVPKDQPLKSSSSTTMAQDAGVVSPAPSVSQFGSIQFSTYSGSTNTASSTLNLGSESSCSPVALSFPAPSGMAGIPGTPGPPGVAQAAPFSSNTTVSTVSVDSSSSVLKSVMPTTPFLSNPVVQQQLYPTYHSLPPTAASPPVWLQSRPMANLARPPFVSYHVTIPGPYPLVAMPLPSVSLPDSNPPGVTPVGSAGTSYGASVHQLASGLEVQQELAPPGIDNSKKVNDIGIKEGATIAEQFDAWTAHKTDSGVVYYYNAVTGESTYEKPSGFKGEPDKVTVQPTPVSWEKLDGTDWALVTTNDGKRYYYSMKTKLSSWQIPSEVTELKKKEDGGVLKEQSVLNNILPAEKGSSPISLPTPAINTGGRDAAALRSSVLPGSSSALDLIKKKLQDSGAPVTSLPVAASPGQVGLELSGSRAVEAVENGLQTESSKDKVKDANGDGNMSDSSSDSEDEESGLAKELCIIQFKEMLKERGVAPFSKWEKELPKIVFDPRFKAIPSHSARRSLFEHYVKTRAEEERKEKRAAQKAATEGFKQLLDEASEDIDHKTDYHTFRKKWGSDPRFQAVDRKDRELLLNERVIPLKKAAEEKVQARRAATASSFKSMLREKGDITMNTRWSRVKDSLRDDPRYKSVKHEEREILFNEYISELKAAEEEAEREAKLKRQEQEKLKERERELRKRKEREEEEMERVRLKVRRKETISSYQALLVETIKDPQASWTESKPKLEKDPQGRATNPDLDSTDLEKLFREHVKMLHERCANEFRALLAEVLTAEATALETEDGKTVLNSWSTAKRLLKPDPRYTKMPRKERESLWHRYSEEMQRKQKLALDKKDNHTDGKSKNPIDTGRHPQGARRMQERR